jgi:hypothetical protein
LADAGNQNDWSYAAVANTVYYLNGTVASTTNTATQAVVSILTTGTPWYTLGGKRNNNQGIGSIYPASGFPSTGWPYYIGSGGYPGRGFQGKIAAVLLYNRALSADEQAKNYNYFAKRYGLTLLANPTVNQTIANTTSNTITYLSNGLDEATYNANSGYQKNTLARSNGFDNTNYWSATAATTIPNSAIAPDGTNTAYFLRESATLNNGHFVQSTPTWQKGYQYTYSIYAKAGTRSSLLMLIGSNAIPGQQNATFNLTTGVVSSISSTSTASMYSVGNGWWRCILTTPAAIFTGTSTIWASVHNGTTVNYTGDGVSGIYIYGAQVEPGTTATIYEETTSISAFPAAAGFPVSNSKFKLDNTGTTYVTGVFDEVNNIVSANGLTTVLDVGKAYNTSKNTIPDLVSNNDGLIQNGATYSSANGGIMLFNGVNQYITTTKSNPSPINQIFSIGAWFKTSSTNSGKIIGHEYSQLTLNNATYDRQLYMGSDGRLKFGVYNNLTITLSTNTTYTDNIWHYAVGSLNATTGIMNLYVDGNLANTTTGVTSPQTNNSSYWKIGGTTLSAWPYTNTFSYFNGSIGPVHIYNRDITSAEVLDNYNSLRSRFNV